MLVKDFKEMAELHSFYFDTDCNQVKFGNDLVVFDFDEPISSNETDEMGDDEIKDLADYLMEQWNKSNSSDCDFTAGDILLNGCDFDESWSLKDINAEIENFFYEMRQFALALKKQTKEVA